MSGLLSRTKSGLTAPQRRSISPFREVENFIERFWNDEGDGWGIQMLAPALDMSETADAINLRLDLPGVNAKEIDIQVNRNQLTISGERKVEEEETGQTFHRAERRVGRFSRSVVLPCEVSDNNVEANYRDGVLRIKLPKSPESKSRHITVTT
ncbi:MAG: Hsp20/alpha crystallin family protein [Pirellulaceae bacterium]|nr:Hsp20/alpha crystallin family protein [Pirellulaceae bacterium]